LVEHTAENRGVAGSIPALAIAVRNPARCARHDDFERLLVSIQAVVDDVGKAAVVGGPRPLPFPAGP
jgi:hypothetical protein